MYSDMPMGEMAKDPEFPKKWMFGMAMMLKKGLHLNQIHDLNRSFEDMMLGLESWIPMYMTGQISPFYLKEPSNSVFLHLLKVSGAAALCGEAIVGHHAEGRYYLTKSRKELGYYTARAQELLSAARPLMDIYRIDNKNEFNAFLQVGFRSNREAQEHPLFAAALHHRCVPSGGDACKVWIRWRRGGRHCRCRHLRLVGASCIFLRLARSMSRYRCLPERSSRSIR